MFITTSPSMETLPYELLAKIILILDRQSLTAFVITCKILLKKSNNQELLNIVGSDTQTKVPKSRLLILRDYMFVNPRNYVPVYLRDKSYALLFDWNLHNYIGDLCICEDFEAVVEVNSRGITENITIPFREIDNTWRLMETDGYETEILARGNNYFFNTSQSFVDILSEIYQREPYHIVKIQVKELS
jgi:hypothetical protein